MEFIFMFRCSICRRVHMVKFVGKDLLTAMHKFEDMFKPAPLFEGGVPQPRAAIIVENTPGLMGDVPEGFVVDL